MLLRDLGQGLVLGGEDPEVFRFPKCCPNHCWDNCWDRA
jgi:hypothetical protein